MLYCVQANVTWSKDGWNTYIQVPTFYLDSQVQGIVSVDHAEKIARDIINPTKDETLWVSANVTEVE